MPLQDLTPQLRTRLNRMERAVGWFVSFAMLLLLAGFITYIYHAAVNKGWFKIKAQFYIYVATADGISVGDTVSLMGSPIGAVTKVEPPAPREKHGVKVTFEVLEPSYRYIWSEGSYVKASSSGLLGKRGLEVTRGTNGFALCSSHPVEHLAVDEVARRALAQPQRWQMFQNLYDANSNLVLRAYAQLVTTNLDGSLDTNNLQQLIEQKRPAVYVYDNTVKRHSIASTWNRDQQRYEEYTGNAVQLPIDESPALTERLDQIVMQIQTALPNILALTNRLARILDNAANVTSNLNNTLVSAQPMVTNFAVLSGNLRQPGGLGAWALGTNGADQLNVVLTNTGTLLAHTDTNLDAITEDIGVTLIHLGNITSNLDTQVANNPQAMSNLVKSIADTDDLIQGLKRHWLLRSAFKKKATNAPAVKK